MKGALPGQRGQHCDAYREAQHFIVLGIHGLALFSPTPRGVAGIRLGVERNPPQFKYNVSLSLGERMQQSGQLAPKSSREETAGLVRPSQARGREWREVGRAEEGFVPSPQEMWPTLVFTGPRDLFHTPFPTHTVGGITSHEETTADTRKGP